MNLTLRAAHKLVEKINSHIKTIEINPSVTVNAYEVNDAEAVFAQHLKEFETNVQRVETLLDIRANLRQQIGQVNARGVNDSIALRKNLIEHVALYQRVLSNKDGTQISSASALDKKIKTTLSSKGDNIYGHSDSITFTVMSKDMREKFVNLIAENQRAIEQVEDVLLQRNLEGTVQLQSAHVDALRREHLI